MRTEALACGSVTRTKKPEILGGSRVFAAFLCWSWSLLVIRKKGGSLAFDGEVSAPFFFKEDLTPLTNFKDAACAGSEGDFLCGHGFDFS